MRKNGFTMIEFMVVAVLIGILATLGMSAYSKTLARGRDTKRVQDVREVQKSFELYYSINNSYNAVCDDMFTDQTGRKPSPPVGTLTYFGDCDATEYIYCASLELGEDYGNANCTTLGTASTCTLTNTSPNSYCVVSVQ
jgi:prepilin-type N-terminal cleavage/methylation domain-containing protein